MQAHGVPVQPGDILLGKYRVEDIIGVGGMGCVVKAAHLYLQQPVAIKILLPQMTQSPGTVARFVREAQAMGQLRSEHIARVMDVGTMPDGVPFMVMEYLDGYDLNQILRHHGPQMPTAVVDLMLQACEGIAEAHAIGIIHRDIKPSNFFITRRPDGSNLLKILDFGISKTAREVSELTGTQTVIGTPTYMAPEQMRQARSTDPRSDVWAMGVVMYQMLAGRPPFEAETYAELVLKVGTDPPAPLHVALPNGLHTIVMRCLEKDPKNRIQSVGELSRMLAPFASDPLSAQQSADRAGRILTTPRGSQPGFPLGAGPGGGGLTPPALTPKSWNANDGSSLSGSAGQVGTQQVRSKRGWVIGGVASLCIAAGGGGFLIANATKSSGDGGGSATTSGESHVTAPDTTGPATQPAPPPPTTPPAPAKASSPAPSLPPPTPTMPAPPRAAAPPPKAEPRPAPETTTRPTPAATTRPKTVTTKPKTTKPATTKKSKDDDLFDDRH